MTWDVVSCDELWWEVNMSEVDLWGLVKSKGKAVISSLWEVKSSEEKWTVSGEDVMRCD